MSVPSGFKISSVRIDNNNADFQNADAWQVRITNPRGQRLQRKFYMGYGHKGAEPKLEEVMSSLVTDAACVEDRDLEEFAADLGYSLETPEETRHVRTIYNACERIAKRLATFLTDEEREAFSDY